MKPLLEVGGISVTAAQCDGRHAGWSHEEALTDNALVLVRSGHFRRRVEGAELLADASFGYVERRGTVQQIAHPQGGDVCTVISLSETAMAPIAEAMREMAGYALPIPPLVDLAHRTLLKRIRDGGDLSVLAESTTLLVGHIVEIGKGVLLSRGRGPAHANRRLADAIREALSDQPELSLDALAHLFGVSPYRLSRAFKAVAGITVSEHRIRLRSRMAMDRIAGGDANLAGIAVDAGFADQAHMTRTLRRQIHLTPRALRHVLA